MRSLVLAALVLLLVASGGRAHGSGSRFALVIGNAGYQGLPSLDHTGNDAALIASTLRDLGFEVVEMIDADRRSMTGAVLDLAARIWEAGPDTVGLFYYAGHGVQSEGRNLLIPVGPSIQVESELLIQAVSAGWVVRQMKNAGNNINVVILDASRNDPFQSRLGSVANGLAPMEAPEGTLVAYAAEPGKTVENGARSNSPYAAALARGMRTPGLTVEEMFEHVRGAVVRETGGAQRPWEQSSLRRDFYFVPPGLVAAAPTAPAPVTPPPVAPAPPPEPAEETDGEAEQAVDTRELDLAFWQSIEESEDWRYFQAYLDRFGEEGTFSSLARLRRDDLKRRQEEPDQAAALPSVDAPPAASRPEVSIEAMREPYRVVTRSNVRAGPGTRFERLETLPAGRAVTVTGKVRGENWYRIDLGDREGFISGSLIQDEASWKEARKAESTVAEPQRSPSVKHLEPGSEFRDCAECPEMVVIPAGRFTMGSPYAEEGRADDEGPQHQVELESFALGKYEVTFAQYDACVRDRGCPPSKGDEAWGRGRRPVINVSWRDAQAYVRWLSRKTGRPYRLPSEAEWEYAARAGSSLPYAFGGTISLRQANFAERLLTVIFTGGKSLPVGSYRANSWGLHDMHGNVWEWVEDCWHETYAGAPVDGSAWTSGGDCGERVVRGGSWHSGPSKLRSANRLKERASKRSSSDGFRVAMSLEP